MNPKKEKRKTRVEINKEQRTNRKQLIEPKFGSLKIQTIIIFALG